MPVPVHCIFAFESQRASHNKPTFLRGLCHVDIDGEQLLCLVVDINIVNIDGLRGSVFDGPYPTDAWLQ